MSALQVGLKKVDQNDVPNIILGMEDDGAVVIPQLLSKEEVKEMIHAIDNLKHVEHDRFASVTGIDHFKCVFNRNPYWLSFIDKKGVIDGIESLMGADCHIIGMSAWRTPPGSKQGGKMHIDQLILPMDEDLLVSGRVKLPIYYSTLHFYLNDMDLDLAPTWVVPGSHKSGRGPYPIGADGKCDTSNGELYKWNDIEEEPILVDAGDGMLFRSEVWHRGSPNVTTDRTRYMLQVHYGRRGVAHRFPPYLEFTYNKDVLKCASDRQLRLLGKHKTGAYG